MKLIGIEYNVLLSIQDTTTNRTTATTITTTNTTNTTTTTPVINFTGSWDKTLSWGNTLPQVNLLKSAGRD